MNKKLIIIISIFVAISGAMVFALTMKSDDQIVATVNSNPVYLSEIHDKLNELLSANFIDKSFSYDNLNPEMKQNIIKSIIVGRLIGRKADEAKISESAEYKKIMELESDQIKQKLFLEANAKNAVTDTEIKQKYDDFVKSNENKEEVKASQIIFDTEEEAKAAYEKIKSGSSFEEVQKSSDKKNNEANELDYFNKEQMPEAFSNVAFSLVKDQVSEPVKTEFGWHLIKMLDKRKAKLPSFDEMSVRIKTELTQKFIQDFVENILRENKVEITLKQ